MTDSTADGPDPVVSLDWLADHLADPGVRVVDVRDAWEYDGIGHVPGAVSIPFDSFRAGTHAAENDEDGDGRDDETGEAGMFPGADVWADLMDGAGIGEDDTLVAYDDTHGVFAARFLVTAEHYGHEDVRLLDGDFSAWSRERGVSREGADIQPGEGYAVGDPVNDPLVDYGTVSEALDDPDTVVVDTREAWEYEEGHLPGAVQIDWRELVNEETRGLRDDDDLRALLEERGITPDRRVLLYCNTARRISHTYVVLRHLGYPNIAFYEGSLTEWERRGGPLETETTGEDDD
ncbi:sulfurtransferase [Halobium salinum]|uniref:Sulfurtransferase n=1 Tax=Halobium salinum TaxID=1364940 RepID=A0ABD5PFW3_9EURY|nr:sulfurtransferase [Halobium salinum]